MHIRTVSTLMLATHLICGCAAMPGAEPYSDGINRDANFALVIHGGGGVLPHEEMTAELEAEYRAALAESLRIGHELLRDGVSALDAVEAAIRSMEDSPLFNAGKGSTFNIEGFNELDASIMDGRTLNAGGVAIVRNVRNPITLARIVMEKTPHVLMAADGAEQLAREHGLEPVPPYYFWTERRWNALQQYLKEQSPYGDRSSPEASMNDPRSRIDSGNPDNYSTVGAVALDQNGNLAAGTSTGGRLGKLPGRIGDSPIIGAGTWADNNTAAVSSTGLGEYVLRTLGTKRVGDLIEHRGLPLDEAVEESRLHMKRLGGSISLIAVNVRGEVSLRYSGAGMYRGYILSDGQPVVQIYED